MINSTITGPDYQDYRYPPMLGTQVSLELFGNTRADKPRDPGVKGKWYLFEITTLQIELFSILQQKMFSYT